MLLTMGLFIGFPWWLSGWRICLQCKRHKRHGFDHWVRKFPWKRKWQPTKEMQPSPVFLPGKSHGRKSLAGYNPWGHKVRPSLVTNQQLFLYILFQILFRYSFLQDIKFNSLTITFWYFVFFSFPIQRSLLWIWCLLLRDSKVDSLEPTP